MEGLSEESKQAWFPALGGRIGNSFHNHGMEHFPLTCTATLPTARDNDRICPINDYLPICNELLFNIGIELREQRGGTLSLVCFQPDEPYVSPPPDADLHRSSIFLRWLLRTHVCITSLTLHYNRATAHGHAVLEELPENTHLQKLRAEFRLEATTRISLATLLPRLRYLKELYCYVSPSTVSAVSTLLRTATCLTSLCVHACFENSQPPKIFTDALAANRTLKYLEIWTSWNTEEPPGTLGEYVRGNGLLTNLHVFGEGVDREALLLEEALVCNSTLSTMRIYRVCGGERTARFMTRILAECTGLKKLTIGESRDRYKDVSEETLTRCAEALGENEILEELTLSYSLWHPTNWVTFFAFLPKNRHLKKLEVSGIFFGDTATPEPVLEALAQTDPSGRVSFGYYMPTTVDVGLMGFRAYSEVHIFGEMSVKLSALQRLPSFDHFTSVTLDLSEPDQRLFHSAADYIRATTVLRKLKIYVFHSAEVAPSSCWTLLFESILANTSISDLEMEGTANFSHAGSFARTVGLSRCITRVSYSRFRSECNPTSFVVSLSEAISHNYNLLEIHLYSYANLGAEARCSWFTVRETIRRNWGLVELAGALNKTTVLDR
ncbi:hypothetical protein MTO96_040921 [Rhipicephalus appendiculatus]